MTVTSTYNKLVILTVAALFAHVVSAELNCGANQFQAENTPLCPITCQTKHMVRCLALTDVPSCQCNVGYLFDEVTGQCVPKSQCPARTQDTYNSPVSPVQMERIQKSCDPNTEYFTTVTPACPPACMHGYHQAQQCLTILEQPSCQCKHGLLRDLDSGKCIHPSQCHFRY